MWSVEIGRSLDCICITPLEGLLENEREEDMDMEAYLKKTREAFPQGIHLFLSGNVVCSN